MTPSSHDPAAEAELDAKIEQTMRDLEAVHRRDAIMEPLIEARLQALLDLKARRPMNKLLERQYCELEELVAVGREPERQAESARRLAGVLYTLRQDRT